MSPIRRAKLCSKKRRRPRREYYARIGSYKGKYEDDFAIEPSYWIMTDA